MFTPVINAPRLVVATAPAEEPVTIDELKLALHIDQDVEDTLLTALLAAARGALESITGRSFVQTQWVAYFDIWPLVGAYIGACQSREIELPKAPLLAVEDDSEEAEEGATIAVESIKYLDADGAEQTLDPASYTVEPSLSPNCFGRVWLNPGVSAPTLGDYPGALRVTFNAGYGDAAAVPDEIKAAIKLLAAHLHTNPLPVNVGNIVNEVPYTLKFLIEHLTVRAIA